MLSGTDTSSSSLQETLIDNPAAMSDAMIAECHAHLKKFGENHLSTKMLASQILLAFMGSLAGMLYWDPAKACAEGVCNDDAITTMIPDQLGRQLLYFLSGFIGYSSTNCTFAFYGPAKLADLLSKLPSKCGKVSATLAVLGIMGMQGFQLKLGAEGTGSGPLTMTLTVLGAFPGAMFGASNTVAKISDKISQFSFRKLQKSVGNKLYDLRLKSLTEEARLDLLKEKFYEIQRKKFNMILKAGWEQILVNAAKISFREPVTEEAKEGSVLSPLVIERDEEGLDFLLRQYYLPKSTSGLEAGFRGFMKLTELALTAAFTAPMLNNTYQKLDESIVDPRISAPLTLPLCWASLVGNVSLMNKASSMVTDTIVNFTQGKKSIPSLAFQLRPWTTTLSVLGSSLCAAFSYSVVDIVWNKMYAPAEAGHWNFDFQTVGRIFARVGIDIYHAMGPADTVTTHILLPKLLKGNPVEKFLASLQLLVDYLINTLPQDKFVNLIEKLDLARLGSLGVDTWDNYLKSIQNHATDKAYVHHELKSMGLERFADLVDGLPISKSESSVISSVVNRNPGPLQTPTASHWRSSSFVINTRERGNSDCIDRSDWDRADSFNEAQFSRDGSFIYPFTPSS